MIRIEDIKEVCSALTRKFVDYNLQVNVIPRTNCIRIVDQVKIDPTIDYSIFPDEKDFIPTNLSNSQYSVYEGSESKGVISFNEIVDIVYAKCKTNVEIR